MKPGGARLLGRGVVHALLLLAAALVLVPLLWLVGAAVRPPDDLFSYLFLGPRLAWTNFQTLFTLQPFGRFLVNSLFVTSTIVVLQWFFSSLAGFALARYEFRGKGAIMLAMLAAVLLPPQVIMAPLYEQIYRLGLMDSHAGLIIPAAVSVFGCFLFRQAMLSVPDELLQAGRLDGCSEFEIYRLLAMPVVRPMSGAFCLLAWMTNWNNFLWPQIILHRRELFTVPIGLNQLISLTKTEYGAMMAGTLLGILPVIILFLLLQREFIANLTAGAVKG